MNDGADHSTAVPPVAAASRPPCILQVLPALVTGGVERGAVDVAAATVAAGWRSIVISAGGPMTHELERSGARHLTLPVDSKYPWTIRRNIDRLVEVIEREGVDLIHARSRAPAWSAWHAAQRARRPFVTTFHGVYNAQNRLKHWYNSVMARGDRVIAISDFIARHVVERYGVDPARVRVIPRGIDLKRFDPAKVTAERLATLARSWRLPDGAPLIMLPGRLTRWKGQTVLIEAVAKLGRRDVCCLLVGSDQGRDSYRAEIEGRVRALGLEGVVRAVDHCRDMPAAFKLADVVVSASTDPEAFGRVMAEAQAMGRPVVASDHGGARETVRPGETGWLVPPGDTDALAGALKQALALDAAARAAMAERAIAHIRARFNVAEMCRATLKVYSELLGRA